MLDCKEQILNSIANNISCSHAFINTLILTSGFVDKSKNNILINASTSVLQKASKILNDLYSNIEINAWDNFLLISGNIYSVLDDVNYSGTINLDIPEKELDKLTILKTLFITNGNFYYNNDNSKNSTGYNFEIVLKTEHSALAVLEILKIYDFELKMIKRQTNFVVYTKNSSVICDLFVLLGASYLSLEIQNNLAMRELRNSANRQNNCYGFNLDKTITASNEQLKAINYIVDNYSIDYLDENLRDVALARIANPDITLKELQIVLGNTLTRAGIKYRLDKIIDIAKKLKGEK